MEEKKSRLESIQGTLRQNNKTIKMLQARIEELSEIDENHREIPLLQRDIWDLENENTILMNEFKGRCGRNGIPKGVGGVWIHINDVIEYVGLLEAHNFEGNYQKIKRLISLIPDCELDQSLFARERVEYIRKRLRGEQN